MPIRPKVVYSRRYNFGFPGLEKWHRFDIHKFARAMRILKSRGVLRRSDVLKPSWPNQSSLTQIHTIEYLRSLRSAATLARIVEVPLVERLPSLVARHVLLNPMRWAVGGTLLAAEQALKTELAVNLGGGFHHAHRGYGHGFCALADVAIAIASLRARGLASRFLIIDLDAHQGDGLEDIFQDDHEVLIYDVYNGDVFPGDEAARAGITWEVRLGIGADDDEYLDCLATTLPGAIEKSKPDLVFYLAGTDIVHGDTVGLMDVSREGVLQRDRFVLDALRDAGYRTVMLTAGGYTPLSAELIADTVEYLFRR
jgi:histone deacetylase 11